ncbi:hypothetical protein VTK26DRAFT_5785 [Humicola hyalothermophila]
MAVQLPSEAAGLAAGILVYSFFCLACGLLLVRLVWVHDERKSYVSMLGLFVCLHTMASIAQQIHTIVRWRDIKTAEYENIVANVGNPELNITGGGTGLDLVLFYIQYYAYNVESMLVLFWAVELANSIFQPRIVKFYRFHASLAAKVIASLLPAAQMILLRFSGIDRSTVGFMVLADAIMILCFASGALILFAILARYIHSRITLASWSVKYGRSSGGTADTGAGTGTGPPALRQPKRSIYDNWLVLRFAIAFVALSLFQIIVVNFQLRAAATNKRANLEHEPDLSAGRAKGDFSLFAPGVTAAPFMFLVFGTTRTFREYMWDLFVPARLRQRWHARARRRSGRAQYGTGATVSVTTSAPGLGRPVWREPRGDEEVGGGGGGGRGRGARGPAAALAAAGNGETIVPLKDLGERDGDAKSDEWPIMKPDPLPPPPPQKRR